MAIFDLDEVVEPRLALAVAAAGVIFSPKVRSVLRRGAVVALTGALLASDTVSAFRRGVARGLQTDNTHNAGEPNG
jgi:hypothetical protein